jgi:hypothetical protein
MCHVACVQSRSEAFCSGSGCALKICEEIPPARQCFHMRVAAKLSCQAGSSVGCRRRKINGFSEKQQNNGKGMVPVAAKLSFKGHLRTATLAVLRELALVKLELLSDKVFWQILVSV